MIPRATDVSAPRTLRRDLGPWASASIVVGTVIGTGVFLKTAVMAQLGGSPAWVLAAWGIAGVLSFTGAMTYAELGGMFPASGGEYVYLRRGYGPFMGYLFAWNRFWIATPGSVAAYAVGSATFFSTAVPLDRFAVHIGGFRIAGVQIIGRLQTALTVMKGVMILGLAAGALLAPRGHWSNLGQGGAFPGWSAMGTMVLAALWAYDGWNNLPMAAGEIRDAKRNLPRATVGGMIAVLATYALVNVGYFHALPFSEVASSSSDAFPHAPAVAARAATQFLGGPVQVLLAVAMTISAVSAMNGSILTGARVPYAVARDGLAPGALARLSAGAHVPAISVVVQGALSCLLALTGSFDQLTDAVVFASWLFYALNAGSVLLLRLREPARERPFRVPGFPVVPIVFVMLAILLLVNTIWASPRPSALGLGMTALGAIVYLVFLRGRARSGEVSAGE
ncbi:MAG: amino acid permease [Deltaproteobacteria bacterium]|nr:MAG: amino acid permease [Deltaproteobacteria bacterium]